MGAAWPWCNGSLSRSCGRGPLAAYPRSGARLLHWRLGESYPGRTMTISAKSLALALGMAISLLLAAWLGSTWVKQGPQAKRPPSEASASNSAAAPTRITQAQADPDDARPAEVFERSEDIAVFSPSNQPAYYVVVASVPGNEGIPDAKQRQLESCLGTRPHYHDSGFFRGFTPNVSVALFGGYPSSRADEVLRWARKCVGDAYIKQATWIGD